MKIRAGELCTAAAAVIALGTTQCSGNGADNPSLAQGISDAATADAPPLLARDAAPQGRISDAATADAQSPDGQGCAWSEMQSPVSTPITAIWGASDTDVYATSKDSILHYDGSAWSVVYQSPLPNTQLQGLWGSSASEIYAAGPYDKGWPIILRGNLRQWTRLDAGNIGILTSVWGSSDTNILAGAMGPLAEGVVLRHDGSTWSPTAAPGGWVYGLWGMSETKVYAVGGPPSGGGAVYVFDGTSWSVAHKTSRALRGVWGSSASDIYAVGLGTIQHFDGIQWSAVPVAEVSNATVEGVWGHSTNDVFAVGTAINDGAAMIVHYDGSQWTRMASPGSWLKTVWGSSSRDVFAGGGRMGTDASPSTSVLLRYACR